MLIHSSHDNSNGEYGWSWVHLCYLYFQLRPPKQRTPSGFLSCPLAFKYSWLITVKSLSVCFFLFLFHGLLLMNKFSQFQHVNYTSQSTSFILLSCKSVSVTFGILNSFLNISSSMLSIFSIMSCSVSGSLGFGSSGPASNMAACCVCTKSETTTAADLIFYTIYSTWHGHIIKRAAYHMESRSPYACAPEEGYDYDNPEWRVISVLLHWRILGILDLSSFYNQVYHQL